MTLDGETGHWNDALCIQWSSLVLFCEILPICIVLFVLAVQRYAWLRLSELILRKIYFA